MSGLHFECKLVIGMQMFGDVMSVQCFLSDVHQTGRQNPNSGRFEGCESTPFLGNWTRTLLGNKMDSACT